jgi:hypothetical protein
MTEYFTDVFPCTDISLKSGGAKLKSNSSLLEMLKTESFILFYICINGNMLVFFFFNLASKYWMIDWCSTPFFAVFQLYRGFRNIGKKSYRNIYCYQVILLVLLFFLFLSLFILSKRYISSINQYRFLHSFPRFFNWCSDGVIFFVFQFILLTYTYSVKFMVLLT